MGFFMKFSKSDCVAMVKFSAPVLLEARAFSLLTLHLCHSYLFLPACALLQAASSQRVSFCSPATVDCLYLFTL